MAKIGTYDIAPSPISFDDKLIGTDSVNNDATKNFTIQEIFDLILNNIPESPNWSLTGNSNTNPSSNFIGTTDATDFVIKTNSVERLRLGAAGGLISSTYINVNNGYNSTVIGNGYIYFSNTSGYSQIQSTYVTGSRILELPNASGQFVLSVNGIAPVNGDVTISAGGGGWSLTGNSGTTAGTNFIGTTDDVDFVIKRNNLTRFKVTTPSSGAYQSLIGVGGLTVYSTAYDAGFTYPLVELDPDQERIQIKNFAGKTVSIYADQITDTRSLSLPDKSGTLATEDYLVYTALINANFGSPTATVLKNTLGVTINWSNPSNGVIRGVPASGTPFTPNKCWITSGSYNNAGQPYIVTGDVRTDAFQRITLSFYLYDGTITSTPNVVNYSVEIRVYP